MPVSVALDFVPPDRDGYVSLIILEGASLTSPLTELETVTDIGTYPNYITHYTTDLAASATDFFAVQWEDDKGARTAIGPRVQGGTESAVSLIADRVRQRDTSLDENIVIQEAESAIESYFGTDPYTVNLATDSPEGRTYRTINGLTYLVMARSMIARIVQASAVQSATLGLVSFRAEAGTAKMSDIQTLLDLAYKELQIAASAVVLDMQGICRIYGGSRWNEIYSHFDQEFRITPWVPRQIER